jgi:hypothetical protein
MWINHQLYMACFGISCTLIRELSFIAAKGDILNVFLVRWKEVWKLLAILLLLYVFMFLQFMDSYLVWIHLTDVF